MEPRVLIRDPAGEGDPSLLIPGRLTGWLAWIPYQKRLSDHHRAVRTQPICSDEGRAWNPRQAGCSRQIEVENLRFTLDDQGAQRPISSDGRQEERR